MQTLPTHYQQISVEVVKKIIEELHAKKISSDRSMSIETSGKPPLPRGLLCRRGISHDKA